MTYQTLANAGTHRLGAMVAGAICAMAVFCLVQASCASADVPVKEFEMQISSTQAGGHPTIIARAGVGNRDTEGPVPCECNSVRDITFSTPAGVVGSPALIPQCSAVQMGLGECPVDSQVGIQLVKFGDGSGGGNWQPVYNMQPAPGQLALLASPLPLIAFYSSNTIVSARTESDYGLEFKTVGIPVLLKLREVVQITWGVPADPIHDPLRFPLNVSKSVGCSDGDRNPLPELIANEYPTLDCSFKPWKGVSANAPEVAFQSNPTSCVGPLAASIDTVGYDLSTDQAESAYPTPTGCDQLGFNPSLTAKPTTQEADSASGVDIELTVPQPLSASTPSASQIRTSRVKLPAGMALNANAADGKVSCSDAQARFGTREQAQCPEYSKVGTLEIESASLPGVLPGAIYLGQPLPGNRYRVFLTADGFSLHVKLAGVALPDPQTGQVTVVFEDLPQTPFERFNLHIFGAERGLLATPTQCGTYRVESEFVPWATGLPAQTSVQFFDITSGPGGTACPAAVRPFAPGIRSGVTDSTGGAETNFVFQLTRNDGDQSLASVDVTAPVGFSAYLSGIPYCSEAALAALDTSGFGGMAQLVAPACPNSVVGHAAATVGAGSRPATFPAVAYLAGPYGGAPLSLAIVTPAVSGPYDLGNVVLRIALHVNRLTGQVTAVADPFPQIIEGIPLRLRRVLVMLDRPHFALNPTNCGQQAVGATVRGDQGAEVSLSDPFQTSNCGALAYHPSVSIRLKGGLNRRGHPAIHAIFAASPGEANTARVSVTLPKGQLLDNSHIKTVCTRAAFSSSTCPSGSRIGRARAFTPILDRPLTGSVYLRSSRHQLPDMVLDLRGQVDIEAVAKVDSVKGRLRTTFEGTPDVPLNKIVLDLAGGKKGLLINSESLCGTHKRATARMIGHNGLRMSRRPRLKAHCGKGQKAKSRRQAGHRHLAGEAS